MPRTVPEVDLSPTIDAVRGRDEPRPQVEVEAGILAAAAVELARHGVAGLEMDAVAERAGVARSTVYRHFGSRNALLSGVVADQARGVLSGLAAQVDGQGTVEDRVAAAFVAGVRAARAAGLSELLAREPLLLRLVTVEGGPVLAAARDRLAELGAAADGGGFDPDRAGAVAEVLVRLAVSFVVTPETAIDLDGEEAVRSLLGPLLHPPKDLAVPP